MALFGDETAIARLEFERMSKMYVPYIQSRISFIKETTGAIDEQGDEVAETDEAWKGLIGTLEIERAMMGARDQLEKLKETALEAYNGSEEAVNEYKAAVIDAQLMVLRLAEDIRLTASQQDYIRVLVDTEQIERALSMLEIVKAGGYTDATNAMRFRGARAAGGPVAPGGSYLVGERGPELFTPGSSGNITPNHAMGGANITVNVNGGDPNSIVRALQQYVRQSGPVPVNTRTM